MSMAAARPTRKTAAKIVPVKVTVDRRPSPVKAPPVATVSLTPKTVKQPAPKASRQTVKAALQQPVQHWPEAKRRRLMWWLVGGGAAIIFAGWMSVVRLEITTGQSGANILTDVFHRLATFHLPGGGSKSAAQQQIDKLNQQIFPQFQQ